MPKPIGAEGERGDRRPHPGERPDLARMRDAQPADVRGALNPGAGDVEGPGEDESEGKADRNQDDEDLLDPRWRAKMGRIVPPIWTRPDATTP